MWIWRRWRKREGWRSKRAMVRLRRLGWRLHEEQGAGHDGGESLDAAVGLLVGGEVFGVECGGEG